MRVALLFLISAVICVGCRSVVTFSDPIAEISLRNGQRVRVGSGGQLVISLLETDTVRKRAHFLVHDAVDRVPGPAVEFDGFCREGDYLAMSPDLRRGYCHLVAVAESEVRLSFLGATPKDIRVEDQ